MLCSTMVPFVFWSQLNCDMFCLCSPTENQKVRLRIHHSGHLVYHPVKLNVDGIVFEKE